MRLFYLALDRPDLRFPSKELARWMHAPTVGNLEAPKRVARYLIGHRRLVQQFGRQVEELSHVVVFTDSDHAGCLKTRESTSSSKLFYGSHMLRSTSITQGVIALSSGQSEFDALVKGTSAGLGAVSMLKDLGAENSKKSTKIDKAVLKHSSTARSREDSSHCYSNIAGTKAHARRHRQNHENPWSLEPGRSWNQTP